MISQFESRCTHWAILAICLVGFASVLLVASPFAHAAGLPVNGDFEAGTTGWAPADGGTLTVGGAQPVNGGASAGHVQSTGAGTVTIRTQYWLTPAVPGKVYTLSLALSIPAATISSVSARIDLVNPAGVVLVSNATVRAGPTAGYVTVTATGVTAPPNTANALVVISGTAIAAGAHFSVDDVVITEFTPPPPAPTPTPAPAPTAAPAPPAPAPSTDPGADPESEPVPPARIAPSPRAPRVAVASPTPVRTPSPAPGDPPAPLATRLTNGSFDTNLNGWNIARGRAWTDGWIPGEGPSMILHAPASGTVWAEQALGGIQPGEWYQASALLSTRCNVRAGWLRIAWHASDDGSGAAISTDDSFAVDATDDLALAAAPLYQVVGTGAVRASATARSATVRMLLRPEDASGAWLLVDDVAFSLTEAPETLASPPRPPSDASMSAPGTPPDETPITSGWS